MLRSSSDECEVKCILGVVMGVGRLKDCEKLRNIHTKNGNKLEKKRERWKLWGEKDGDELLSSRSVSVTLAVCSLTQLL